MPDSTDTNPQQHRQSFDWYAIVLLICGFLGLITRCFRAYTFAFYEDDFFYYTQPARNWVLHGLSSFDGVHLTNGYHPLWFLTIAGVYKAVPESAFLWAIQFVSFALLMCLYAALVRCMKYLNVATALQRRAALLISLQALLLYRYGMEMIIALPAGMAMVAYVLSPRFCWTARQCIAYGFLAVLTVLGRLDNIFLVALLLAGQTIAAEVPWATRLRRVTLYGVGFLPFAMYLFINHHWFHTLLPISGSAKQLKPLFPPSSIAFQSLILPMDRMKMTFILPAMAVLAAGIVQLIRVWRQLASTERAVYLSLLGFPIAQLCALSLISDWIVWPWYYYVFCYSTLATLALYLDPRFSLPKTLKSGPALFVAILSFYYVVYISVYSFKKPPDAIAMLGGRVAEFARAHPGVYAIGDEAGAPAWFSGQPVIQLEGLMMDAEYLKVLRQNPTLVELLQRYHAQYYVRMMPTGTVPVNGCYGVSEPSQAGPLSLHINGKLCGKPIYITDNGIGASSYIFFASDAR